MTALALQSFRLDWLNLQSSLEYRWNVSTQVSKYKEFELGLNPTCRIPLVPSLLLDLPLISFTRIGVKALRAQHLSVAFYQRPEEQICYLLWVSPRRPNIRNVILKSDPKPEPSFLPLCFPLQTLFLPLSFPLQNSLVAAPVHKDVYPGGRGGVLNPFPMFPKSPLGWLCHMTWAIWLLQYLSDGAHCDGHVPLICEQTSVCSCCCCRVHPHALFSATLLAQVLYLL